MAEFIDTKHNFGWTPFFDNCHFFQLYYSFQYKFGFLFLPVYILIKVEDFKKVRFCNWLIELVPKLIDYALKRMVLEQALGKTSQIGLKSGPVFLLNSRKLFQN
jgi:hypothetical protein